MRIAAILFLSLLPVLACTREEKAQEPLPGKVTATAVYEKFFGPPPAVREGEAFAVVGFLPLASGEGRVRPIPLFMIAAERRPDLLVSHLLGLPASSLPPGVANPFPPGTHLVTYSRQGDTAIVDLSFPAGPLRMQGIVSALGHSLVQFPEIRRVRVTADGTPLPGFSEEGYLPDPKDVLAPREPCPIGVAGTWEGGRPEEVSVFFDRPVAVRSIRLTSERQGGLEGDYYRSVFDMAVVVHPADPEKITDGMPVTVEWQVADSLGRSGSGRETFRLRRIDHP